MSWDTNACLKSLCVAYCDFQQNSSEQNVQDLQRQIDVLLGVTNHGGTVKGFSPKQIVYTESLSALVSIVNTPNLEHGIYIKSIMALSQLANDLDTCISLQKTFNLGTLLVLFLLRNTSTSSKQLKLQTLRLMQKMTYNNKIFVPNIYTNDLMSYLIKMIYTSSSSDEILAALMVVASLSQRNTRMQAIIKAMDDVKILYEKLFNLLSHADLSFSISSLLLLTSLMLNEDMGEKVFNGKNLNNITQLIFNTIITKDDFTCRQYAVDLLIDLLKTTRIATFVAGCEVFETYIDRVFNILHSTDAKTTAKIFELLACLCENQITCANVVNAFLQQQTSEDEETQLPTQTNISSTQAVLHWITCSGDTDDSYQASLLAIIFLRLIFTVCIQRGVIHSLTCIKELLQLLLGEMTFQFSSDEENTVLKRKCERLTAVIELLISLCTNEGCRTLVITLFPIDHLCLIVTQIFESFARDIKTLRNPAFLCSQELVLLVTRTLEIVSKLKHSSKSGVTKYLSLILDDRLIPFLAHGVTSKSKYLVHASLQILAEAMKTKDFKLKIVGDVLVLHNNSREDLLSLRCRQLEEEAHTQSQPPQPPLRNLKNKPQEHSVNVAVLTEKLKRGLDIKDSKLSDIMELYEQKLASFSGRENQLEDLISAKTSALTQSDRLLAQYRCRQAQSEAECLKLRSMLQQNERKAEIDTNRIEVISQSNQDLEKKFILLNDELSSLRDVAREHKQLFVRHQEQGLKLESLEKSLESAEEEHVSLAAMNECLLRNIETLKQKVECANERLKLAEEDHNKLFEQLKEKDRNLTELQEVLQEKDVDLTEQRQHNDGHVTNIKSLRYQISCQEKLIEETNHKVCSLELVCTQNENALKEREDTITQIQAELEKQTQIAAMIHNLTSGKINMSKES